MAGRSTISSNALWRVSNGRSIDVSKDRWVPNDNGGLIIPTDTSNRFTPLSVSDLINHDSKVWTIDHIEPFLSQSDASAIKAIPIGDLEIDDKLIWPHEKNGIYSVKSGYHCIHSDIPLKASSSASSSHSINSKTWNLVWSIKTTPKIQHFLWRVISGSIPTFWNLYKRKILTNPTCCLCGESPETVEHCILLCPWTDNVWFGGALGYIPSKMNITSIDRWLLGIKEGIGAITDDISSLLTYIAQTMWEIWKARNAAIFNFLKPNPESLIFSVNLGVTEMINAWYSVAPSSSSLSSSDIPKHWVQRRN